MQNKISGKSLTLECTSLSWFFERWCKKLWPFRKTAVMFCNLQASWPASLIGSVNTPIIKGFMGASLSGLILKRKQFGLGTLRDDDRSFAVQSYVQWHIFYHSLICINLNLKFNKNTMFFFSKGAFTIPQQWTQNLRVGRSLWGRTLQLWSSWSCGAQGEHRLHGADLWFAPAEEVDSEPGGIQHQFVSVSPASVVIDDFLFQQGELCGHHLLTPRWYMTEWVWFKDCSYRQLMFVEESGIHPANHNTKARYCDNCLKR